MRIKEKNGIAPVFSVIWPIFHTFFLKVKEELKSIAILIFVPDLYKFRCHLDEDLTVFMGICVVALPQIFFIFLFEHATFFLNDQAFVFSDTFR